MAGGRIRHLLAVLALAGLCAVPAVAPAAAAPAGADCVSPDNASAAFLEKAVNKASNASDAAIGLYDRRTATTCYYLPDRKFNTASVVKALIATALQWRAQQEDRPLDPTTEDRKARDMITSPVNSISNDAAKYLWDELYHNGTYITDVIDELGMDDTKPAVKAGDTETTARDQVKLMKFLTSPHDEPLERERREYVLQRMAEIPWKHRFGIPVNAPVRWHSKIGYSELNEGELKYRTHSVGAVRGKTDSGKEYDYVLAILTDGNNRANGQVRVSAAAAILNQAMRDLPESTTEVTPEPTPGVTADPMTLAEAVQPTGLRDKKAPGTCETVTITSSANRRLVSTELGWTGDRKGMARARATAAGPWERYRVCFDGDNSTILSLANNRYVSAELGWSGDQYGMLSARASAVGPWERFSFVSCGTECVAIRSSANGLYVSAELGWSGDSYGMLRARAAAVGEWERFR